MPPYRNTQENLSGSMGPDSFPFQAGSHNQGMTPNVFDDMAKNMREAFAASFEGVNFNSFIPSPQAASAAGPGASTNTNPSASGPNVGNLGNGAGFSFHFASTPGEHGLPREGPPPPVFDEHERRPYGFNWAESTAQGAAHPGSNPYNPSKDSEPRHHHQSQRGGRGNSRGRFNPYGRGGPPPNFHHRHYYRPPPPPPFGDGSFPFGIGGPFGRGGPFGFRGSWVRRPPPPPFAPNMDEAFETMRQQQQEAWQKFYERMADMRNRMNDAQNAHDHGFDPRFGGAHHHTGRDGHHHSSRHNGRASSSGDEGVPPRSRAAPKPTPSDKTRARSVDFAKAWETYSAQWKKLTAADAPSTINLSEIPWPVIVDTSKMKSLSDMTNKITATTVGEFILSPKHSPDVPNKKRIHQALRLYHPDRFETAVVAKVEEKDKKTVRELGEVVAKCLNKLLEKEN